VLDFAEAQWGLECEEDSFVYHNYSTTVTPVLAPRSKRTEKDQNYLIVHNPSLFTQDRIVLRLPQDSYTVKVYDEQEKLFKEEHEIDVIDFPNVNRFEGPADVVELTINKKTPPLSYTLLKIQSATSGRRLEAAEILTQDSALRVL